MSELYMLEFSATAFERGAFPFHYSPVKQRTEKNMARVKQDPTRASDWECVFVGTESECARVCVETYTALTGRNA